MASISRFPRRLDIFPEQEEGEVLFADVANLYQRAVIACQVELETVEQRFTGAGKKMLGLVYRVQINNTLTTDNDGNGDNLIDGYRYMRPNHPRDGEAADSWGGGGNSGSFNRKGPVGSSSPPNAFCTLPLPTGLSQMPNGQPFHASNAIFVTLESQVQSQQGNPGAQSWWINQNGTRLNTGGFRALDGLLYHNGVSDYNPQLVLLDWSPQHFWQAGNGSGGDIYTVFVHVVIVG